MFKDRKWIEIAWDKAEYDETLKWVKNTIELIKSETEWKPSPQKYYCNYLCGQRNNACEYKMHSR